MECLGDVGAENLDGLVDGDAFFFDHIAEFCEHRMLIADADANRVTASSNTGMLPLPSELMVIWERGTPASRAAFAALLGFTAFSEPGWLGSMPEVMSM